MALSPFETRRIQDRHGAEAVFKPCLAPHSLLEYTASRLAHAVGLRAPEYLPLRLPCGDFGLVSRLLPWQVLDWADLPAELTPEALASRFEPSAFPGLFAFDAWLGNGDRHQHNLLVRPRRSHPWQLWLIDHTHTAWNTRWLLSDEWLIEHRSPPHRRLETYTHLDNRRLHRIMHLVCDGAALAPSVARIASLPSAEIEAAVSSAPAPLGDGDHRRRLVVLLLERQAMLPEMAAEWLLRRQV